MGKEEQCDGEWCPVFDNPVLHEIMEEMEIPRELPPEDFEKLEMAMEVSKGTQYFKGCCFLDS